MAPPPNLLSLPIELQKDILDLLPYLTLQVLHATHPHFRTLIDLDKVRNATSREDLVDEMVAAYRHDAFRRLIRMPPCRECLRFRPKGEFADNVLQKRKPEKWFCIQCGIDRIYQPGKEIWSGGKPGVWCKKCKIYKSGAEHTVLHGGPLCRVCHTAQEAETSGFNDERWHQRQRPGWRQHLLALWSRVPEMEETSVPDAGERQNLANARKVLLHMRQCPHGQFFTSERRAIPVQRRPRMQHEKEMRRLMQEM
ncbi:MAG: hypothetical protein LQ347_004822 [Umbilicaria vellea]|nr:MAG: hypothetical protein LQ347_004822 [Umbilicaria vellea]